MLPAAGGSAARDDDRPDAGRGWPQTGLRSKAPATALDETHDAVVVGSGYAGMVAGLEAALAGLDAVVYEKEAVPGGISLTSAGYLRCARDADDAVAYLTATNGGRVPDSVVHALAEGMTGLEAYVRDLADGVDATVEVSEGPRNRANYPLPGWETFYLVSIDSVPDFDPETAYPHVQGKFGVYLYALLERQLASASVPVRLAHRVTQLLTDEAGDEVRGVRVETPDGARTVGARRGVVLASGGFESDPWLREQYVEGQPVVPVAGNNTGDGLRLAMDVGADLWHMWHVHGSYGFRHPDPDVPYAIRAKRLPDWVPEPADGGSVAGAGAAEKAVPMTWILLDRDGERFMNEYPPYLQDTAHRPMQAFDPERQRFPRNPAYLVCDEAGRQRYPLGRPKYNTDDEALRYDWSEDNLKEVENGILTRADSIPALAAALDVDPEAMAASVERWNELCERGADEDHARPAGSMLPIAEPPFYAGEVHIALSNTQGGPVRDARGRLVRATGDPIPRLYGAGELGSPFGHLYLSAANIADCFISGRVAARELAAREPWDASG